MTLSHTHHQDLSPNTFAPNFVRRYVKLGLITFCIGLLDAQNAHALGNNMNKKGKNFSLGVTAGLPHFISLELGYLGLNWLSFLVGFGSFPINSLINSFVKIDPIPLATVGGNSFSVVPTTSYALYGVNATVRAHPFDGGFFTQFTYANWTFNGSVGVGLRNDTSGVSYGNIVNGSLTLGIHQLGLLIGYQFFFKFGLFIDLGLGASALLAMNGKASIGGSAADFASIVGSNNLDLDSVKTSINTQVQSALELAKAQIPALPDIFISVGYAF
jgi:hypothetical protein